VNCQGTVVEKPKKVCPEQGHSLPEMDGGRIAQAERSFVEKRAWCSSDFLAIRMAINRASQLRRTIRFGHDGQARKQSEPASSGFYARIGESRLDLLIASVTKAIQCPNQRFALGYLDLCAPSDMRSN
jgi:hypothetical protein